MSGQRRFGKMACGLYSRLPIGLPWLVAGRSILTGTPDEVRNDSEVRRARDIESPFIEALASPSGQARYRVQPPAKPGSARPHDLAAAARHGRS
ncbi:MAG: hypothetical protein GEU91_02270 [Rhizobiales bacterium]|nr:hypothetical protein [Hyphomicrobiales bacterium]